MKKEIKKHKGGRDKQLPARLTSEEIETLRIAKAEMSFSDFIMFLYEFWIEHKNEIERLQEFEIAYMREVEIPKHYGKKEVKP